MRSIKGIILAALFAMIMGMPAFAADTDTAALDIDIDSIFYVDLGFNFADWTDTVTGDDLMAGYIESNLLWEAMDIAGNDWYEITAQMSDSTWDPGVALRVSLGMWGYTTLSPAFATVLQGYDEEFPGAQMNVDVRWILTGLTWTNTSTWDDWTNTVTFTCRADTF